MMLENKGGRGLKAKYPTIAMRIPQILGSEVQSMIENLYEGSNNKDTRKQIEPHTEINIWQNELSIKLMEKDHLIQRARDILLDKKSARVSLEKLLQFIYSDKEIRI